MANAVRKVIEAHGSPTAVAALDAWQAALWLLAIGEIAQALSNLDHAIELAVKGLLEEVDVMFTDNDVAGDSERYRCLKHILSAKIKKHRFGTDITIPNNPLRLNAQSYQSVQQAIQSGQGYDPERTISFGQAIDRVQELVSVSSWAITLKGTFHKKRNHIVHRGAKPEEEKEYLKMILDVGMPFLRDFYKLAYSVDVRDWIGQHIARELLDVDPAYCRKEPYATSFQVLYTFRHAWWWTYRFNFGRTVYLSDEEQEVEDYGQIMERFDEYSRRFTNDHVHGDDYPLGTDGFPSINCRICLRDCLVAAEPTVYEENGEKFLNAMAVYCPNCGLAINSRKFANSLLASIHIGPITKDRIGAKGWEQVLRDLEN